MKYLHSPARGTRRFPAEARSAATATRCCRCQSVDIASKDSATGRRRQARLSDDDGLRPASSAQWLKDPAIGKHRRARSWRTRRARSAWPGAVPHRWRSTRPLGQLYDPRRRRLELLYYREESKRRPDPRGRHQRGGRIVFVDRCRDDVVQRRTACRCCPSTSSTACFGFQRIGDLDVGRRPTQRSRGFLLGATAGRTTLSGEGLLARGRLQPPALLHRAELQVAYDPAFAVTRVALIIQDGMRAACWSAKPMSSTTSR